MSEEEFLRLTAEKGYVGQGFKDFAAHTDGPLHVHESHVMFLVMRGKFELAFENGSRSYLPGEHGTLGAGVLHAERAGPDGTRLLLAKKSAAAKAAHSPGAHEPEGSE